MELQPYPFKLCFKLHYPRVYALNNLKDNKLTALACSFNSDFKHFLASHDSRLLPKLRTGIVQQPINNVYWQKECGAFEATNIWGRQDNLLDVSSLEGDNLRPNCHATGEYEKNGGNFCENLCVEDETGLNSLVQPRFECLMYVGEWSILETHRQVADSERSYWASIKRLAHHSFEPAVAKTLAYKIFISNVTRVDLHDRFKDSHDDAWLLKTFLLRVISGALEMYADPLREYSEAYLEKKRQALDANLGTLLIPNEATAKAANRLIDHIKKSGAQIDWMAKLEDVAAKKPYSTVSKTSNLKAVIREVSTLSQMFLNTSNSHKGRFPITAIQNILELIDHDVTDEGIRSHQEQYDDSYEQYLSSGNINDLPF